MRQVGADLKRAGKQFKQDWPRYLCLFIGLDCFNLLLLLPLFKLLTTYVLRAGEIPLVSLRNLKIIITTHPWVSLILVGELICLLVLFYVEIAIFFLGVCVIAQHRFDWRFFSQQLRAALRRFNWRAGLLILLYFAVLMPLAGFIYRTLLLAKLKMTEVLLDYMTKSWLSLLIATFLYLGAFYLGLRLLFALPLMILQKKTARQACRQSWRYTRYRRWQPYFARLFWLNLLAGLLLLLVNAALYGLQTIWDLFPGKYLLGPALFNLLFGQLISAFMLAFSLVTGSFLLFKDLPRPLKTPAPNLNKRLWPWLLGLLYLLSLILSDSFYLNDFARQIPIAISHRGVDDRNGVQNTIASLKKTARSHPAYVEIDLHESKDQRFVVLHDENLRQLTGVNKQPSQLTLKQLTHLKARENGRQARLASFSQYLKAARRLKQKLLIEIKTTPHDSPEMLTRFNRQYGATIVHDGDEVQSLDYRVVKKLKSINPQLFVLYIQPYNFTFPRSQANGYNMEYSTLNAEFINQAHLEKQAVYVWTVNDAIVMQRMCYEKVDGLVTDRLRLAQRVIRAYRHHHNYAASLLNYFFVFPPLGNLALSH